MPDSEAISALITRWRADPGSSYTRWFLWGDRLKNFGSIRRGLAVVVDEIERGSFGNAYRGSSLETVVASVAEQRQLFAGADHAFLWKPKLRIPDIYEHAENQRAFGRFLATCACCAGEDAIVDAIHRLDAVGIKGLGPAVANLLYFLHPTLAPPSNTAIVNGYNALTGARVKLGRWSEYLAMRTGILRLNQEHRALLSNDLGAIAALLFDLGSGRYQAPPRTDQPEAQALWLADLAQVRAVSGKATAAAEREGASERTHIEIQAWLRDLGHALGFRVWIAANDRGRVWGTGRLGDGCLETLPGPFTETAGADAVRLIDVLWLQPSGEVAAAFEVEHTTSIYSGVVRLWDLALSGSPAMLPELYIVAPDDREADVRDQLRRPAFRIAGGPRLRYIPYGELEQHRLTMARFGSGLKPLQSIARSL